MGLPLGEFTSLNAKEIRELASLKLALVGLAGFEDYYPSEISGGMRKRAGVTHELPSIFSVADNCVFLDAETRTMIAKGDPKRLKNESQDPKVRAFLTRGGKNRTG